MKIKKDDFIFKVAFKFTEKSDIPEQINGGNLFFRFMLIFFIGWPLFKLLKGIVAILLFLFARKFSHKGIDLSETFERWPKIGGYKIYPVWALLLIPIIICPKQTLLWLSIYVLVTMFFLAKDKLSQWIIVIEK